MSLQVRGVELAAGGRHTCALLENGSVKCWGDNYNGELGLGDTDVRGDEPGEMGNSLPAVDLGAGRTVEAITAGNAHMCALLDHGSVKCWGANFYGQLGVGNTDPRGDEPGEMGERLPVVDLGRGRTAVAIAAGSLHTCALLDDSSVKCWGYNGAGPAADNGALGLGDTDARGDEPGEMGDSLPAVDLGTGRVALAIATGGFHTCALLDDRSLKCWGNNYNGELGLGDDASRGDEPGEMGDRLPAVDLGTGRTAVAITAGTLHTCAILDDDSTKCWGYNGDDSATDGSGSGGGGLGLGDLADRGDDPGEMGDSLLALDLGVGRTAVAISASWGHTCALLDDGSAKCWGWNDHGHLGLGDTANRGDDPGEMGDDLPAIDFGTARSAVSMATPRDWGTHTCALLDDGSVKCWGDNFNGLLGLGDRMSRGDDPGEMGDNLPAVEL